MVLVAGRKKDNHVGSDTSAHVFLLNSLFVFGNGITHKRSTYRSKEIEDLTPPAWMAVTVYTTQTTSQLKQHGCFTLHDLRGSDVVFPTPWFDFFTYCSVRFTAVEDPLGITAFIRDTIHIKQTTGLTDDSGVMISDSADDLSNTQSELNVTPQARNVTDKQTSINATSAGNFVLTDVMDKVCVRAGRFVKIDLCSFWPINVAFSV